MADFDVVVLGAGPGGYVAAIRASQLGKKVAVVEKQYWGGVCLNVGCIPSKALLKNAELAHTLTHDKAKYGIEGDATMSFGPTHARSRKVSEGIVRGVHFLMKKNKIEEIDGWGTLTSASSMDVALNSGEKRSITFDNLVLATGSVTRMIPGVEVSKNVVTYEEQILDPELPGSIIIAGSGAIGVEFAYVMKNFGVDVTIVEFLDRMVPTEDADVSKELLKQYKKLGGKVMLSTTAEAMGVVAAETIAGAETMEINFDMIPRATFCQPQIASFGYSEEQAKEKGYDVKTASFPFSANGKARGMAEGVGFVKIVADAKHNEIVGAHLIGTEVTELLPALTLAQQWDLTADEVARNIFAHPTLSEAMKEAVEGIAGHMINL